MPRDRIAARRRPRGGRSARTIGLTLGVLAVPGAMAVGAPSVALPTIARSLHVSFGATAWIIAAWSLGSAIAMPLVGRVAQRRGVRFTLVATVTMLAVGSAMAAAAPTLAVIVGGRFLGGLGVGGMVICIYSYVDIALDSTGRLKALGIIAGAMGAASGAGTLVGGMLTQFAGWRWTLAIPMLAMLAVPLAAWRAPATRDETVRIDLPGAALLSMTGALIITLLQAKSTHLPVAAVAVLAVAAVITAAALVFHVHRLPMGFVPRHVVTAPGLVPAGFVGLSLFAGYYGVLTAAPGLLESAMKLSPSAVGLALLPAAVCAVIAGPIVGAWSSRTPGWQIGAFLGVISASGAIVAALSQSPLLLIAVALGAIGFAGAQVVLIGLLPQILTESDQAVGQGLFNFMLYGGGSIGPALIGGLSGYPPPIALASVAALPTMGIVTCLAMRPGIRRHID